MGEGDWRVAARPLLAVLFLGATLPAAAETEVVLGTAPVAGVYYPAGGALCRLVNEDRASHGVRCLVESTGGSAENLERLRAGDLDFALVQSDWQYHAARNGPGGDGGGDGAGAQPHAALRAVFSLHAQPLSVVAGPRSGIETLADLRGRKVSFGPRDTAIQQAGEALVRSLGWQLDDFQMVEELSLKEQIDALCSGKIDAFVLPVSHPSPAVAGAALACNASLIEVGGAAVEKLVAGAPYLAPVEIPGGLYPANPDPVQSFGLRATLVTTEKVDDETVYRLVSSIFERLDRLGDQHAALNGLDRQEMLATGNSLPFHEGALRYYRERGWN